MVPPLPSSTSRTLTNLPYSCHPSVDSTPLHLYERNQSSKLTCIAKRTAPSALSRRALRIRGHQIPDSPSQQRDFLRLDLDLEPPMVSSQSTRTSALRSSGSLKTAVQALLLSVQTPLLLLYAITFPHLDLLILSYIQIQIQGSLCVTERSFYYTAFSFPLGYVLISNYSLAFRSALRHALSGRYQDIGHASSSNPHPLVYALTELSFSFLTSPHTGLESVGTALLAPSLRKCAHRSPVVPGYGPANSGKQSLRFL
jgi:hypothetical protein